MGGHGRAGEGREGQKEWRACGGHREGTGGQVIIECNLSGLASLEVIRGGMVESGEWMVGRISVSIDLRVD